MNDAVYIHISFCNEICSYCDFPKVYYNDITVDKYLDALEKEIKMRYHDEIISTIYIGGGTPSCLSIKQLERLFRIINLFKTSDDLELTMEANFDSLTKEKIILLAKYHVNRLSFGLQTINHKYLKLLNRNNDIDDIKNTISCCYEFGIYNINVDLMYGFKDQNIIDIKNDLEFAYGLNVSHISYYSLIIEPNTKLYNDHYQMIDDDQEKKLYDCLVSDLRKHGYHHYEISNFSLVNYQSKHNLKYWQHKEYYGFGLGACSYINKQYLTNTKNLSRYLKQDYHQEVINVNNKEAMEYEIMLGLRLIKGVNENEFVAKYQCSIKEAFYLDDLIDNNFLIEHDDYLFINEKYLYISNEILLNFIEGGKQ